MTGRLNVPTQCENCGTPLEGDFCSNCGQSAADINLPLADFAKELASEALSLDSRLSLTMKALFFKPGEVPAEYVAGRRARFVPPIRLYVFASFAMFLLLSFGSGLTVRDVSVNGVTVDAAAEEGADSAAVVSAPDSIAEAARDLGGRLGLGERWQNQLTRGFQRMNEDTESFSANFMNRLAQSMFFLLPAFAGLLKLVHRGRLYVHHLVFAVYLHSFIFLVVAVTTVPDALGFPRVSEFAALGLLLIPIYLLLGMKRFYGQSWMKTAARFAFVSFAYSILWIVTWMGLLIASLMAA